MELTEKIHCVSLVPLFSGLEPASITKIAQKVTNKTVQKGELLASPQQKDETLVIVHQGQLKGYHLLSTGQEQLLFLLTAGEFTGVWSVFQTGRKQTNYLEALTTSELCLLTHQDLVQILQDYPAISYQLLNQMAQRLEKAEKQATFLAAPTIRARISLYLNDLIAQQETGAQSPVVELPLNRKNLAAYLGTTPESVTRTLQKLAAEGKIKSLSSQKIMVLEPLVEE